jgi:broad specificity phosphatase PhoE
MRIFLIRHGESEGNVIYQINDNPQRVVNLTERGRAQAEVASNRLRTVPFTHVYASGFPRAQQTAAILSRQRDLRLNIDMRLNERRSGMDGQHVDVFNDYVRTDYLRIKPPHGESFLEQMDRIRDFFEEAAARHADATILAVSHENPIAAAMALMADNPEQTMRRTVANCEWVELYWPDPLREQANRT